MKIYIMTDLEGPAMVSRWAQTREEASPEKAVAMKLLTWEVNAAVDGILDHDPEAEVIVWDGHGNGGIDLLEFHPRARLIARGPIGPPYGLDSTFDAFFFVGQHAMAGTDDAPLCHTYSSRTIEYYKLNGHFMGEFGCRTAMAGALGVPTVFLAGDDKAVAEAQSLVPGLVGVATKKGMGIELALHLSPKRSQELIRVGASIACGKIGSMVPYRLAPPYELEIRVRPGCDIEGYINAGCTRLDERTVMQKSEDINELYI